MKKTTVSVIMFLFLATAAIAITQWRTVIEWSGAGIYSTETFTITATEWRIRWESTPPLHISVREAGSGKAVEFASSGDEGGEGYTVLRKPGAYYVKFTCWGSGNFKAFAEERITRK